MPAAALFSRGAVTSRWIVFENPDWPRGLHEPNHSLDWVRWRFHDPPNLESQYQLVQNSCQEKKRKIWNLFPPLVYI
jgi:hypothetical protein